MNLEVKYVVWDFYSCEECQLFLGVVLNLKKTKKKNLGKNYIQGVQVVYEFRIALLVTSLPWPGEGQAHTWQVSWHSRGTSCLPGLGSLTCQDTV